MTLLQALVNGNGMMAQFNHRELGGNGQWMLGGMTMVGDMFNHGLKAKVDGLCSELSQLLAQQPFVLVSPSFQSQSQGAVSTRAALRSAYLSRRRPADLQANGGRRNLDCRTAAARRIRSAMRISMQRIGWPWS